MDFIQNLWCKNKNTWWCYYGFSENQFNRWLNANDTIWIWIMTKCKNVWCVKPNLLICVNFGKKEKKNVCVDVKLHHRWTHIQKNKGNCCLERIFIICSTYFLIFTSKMKCIHVRFQSRNRTKCRSYENFDMFYEFFGGNNVDY